MSAARKPVKAGHGKAGNGKAGNGTTGNGAARPAATTTRAAATAKAAAGASTDVVDADLERRASAARDLAYAPYSNFRVGAALIAADGRVFVGANVENASYGLTVCAERNAVMAMVLAGAHDVRTIYVASDIAPPASPCGMCRQTLLEFASDPVTTRVVVVSPRGHHDAWTLAELIPHGFTGDELDRPRPTTSTRRPRRPRRTKAL